MKSVETLIIGAGPAGLTAAYTLARAGRSVAVIERDPVYVGGISRTVVYKGYRFDIGGHRFFSKSAEIEALWSELLGDELMHRPRSSRIYYNGKLFDYPLRAMDALSKLGPIEAVRSVFSYAKAQVSPFKPVKNYEEWVVNNFGRRLFEIFFKTYTEKVWGMDCKDISADWAAQRIKGLNLFQAIVSSFGLKSGGKDKIIKTLIDAYRYPKLGPGAMWEKARDRILDMGGDVRMGATIDALSQDGAGRWQVAVADSLGRMEMYSAQHVISTTSISELIDLLGARVPADVRQQAAGLRYRDFLIVGLIMKGQEKFADNWVYIHDPKVKVGRIQNFKSWSPFMVPDPSTACYGLEYFCFEGDGVWSKTDASLIALATKEIDTLGLASADSIIDGTVIRQRKAYPVYDDGYQGRVDAIRTGLDAVFSNLHFAGRNGMHKYNNQDHAMMTGLLTARNIIAGKPVWNVWAINQDAEYHESGEAGAEVLEERLVPRRVA